jgi:DtxR family Mn-dependent transcriptional regulator
MVGVKDNSAEFLKYVDQLGLSINQPIKVKAKQAYDNQIDIEVNGKKHSISPKFAEQIIIVCPTCNKNK